MALGVVFGCVFTSRLWPGDVKEKLEKNGRLAVAPPPVRDWKRLANDGGLSCLSHLLWPPHARTRDPSNRELERPTSQFCLVIETS